MANKGERTFVTSLGRCNEHDGEGKIVEESPVLRELRRRVAEPGPWAQRFRRLAEAIAGAPDAGPEEPLAEGGGLSCGDCEELLDVYVGDALQGHDVQRVYPHVWQHLRTCPHCRRARDLLTDTLQKEREGQLPSLPRLAPPRLSFLRPCSGQVLRGNAEEPSQALGAPWIANLRSRLDGAPFGLSFTLNPSYLRSLLTPPVPQPVRAEEALAPPSARLVLADTVTFGEEQLAVEVIARPIITRPDHVSGRAGFARLHRLHLQATIASSGPLPAPLWATLTWAGERRSGRVDDRGQVDLGEVSLQALEEALEAGEGEVSLAFEEKTDVESPHN